MRKLKYTFTSVFLLFASIWIWKPYIGGHEKDVTNKSNAFHADERSHEYVDKTDAHANRDNPGETVKNELEFYLKKYADSKKRILIAYFEISYMDLAVNFYYTSINRLNITNYLLLTTNKDSCNRFKLIVGNSDAHCAFINKSVTHSFRSQTMQKSNFVFQALQLGYTVVLADIDIVFFQNPLMRNFELLDSYDMVFQMDRLHPPIHNSGFYAVKPSKIIMLIYKEWVSYTENNTRTTEQRAFNALLPGFLKSHDLKIKAHSLSTYTPGCRFWENSKNISSKHDPFSQSRRDNETVIVHNNCAGGHRKKIYLFKESLLWRYDEDGYYSDSRKKYLMYDNIITRHDNLKDLELSALQCALSIAFILNRILILPNFHCYEENSDMYDECSILQFNFTALDNHFQYREHSFLYNPLTSPIIKESISDPLIIGSKTNLEGFDQMGIKASLKDARCVYPNDTQNGASPEEIRMWFGKSTESVLYFPSLYQSFIGFKDETQFGDINMALDRLSGPDPNFWTGKMW